jgi:single-stranded-DNA-specific exonuclease
MDFKYKNINSIKGFGNDILLNILKARGIEDTNLFLNLNDKVLEDYKNYDNMDIAGKTYLNHINSENKIGIVIDFDCDGFTSASEMFLYTKEVCNKLNKNFNTEYIMHDHKSHGLDESIMKTIKEGQYNLLLIPDAGTNDYKQHKELKDLNMDIICLDHHQSKKYSNDAIIVNNQMSSKIKNKAMTGVGVVYKFCKYIDELLKFNIADDYLDIVALGMIADSADLRDLESRYLVLEGLKLIQNNTNKNQFISRLYKEKAYSMNNLVTITGVAFYMCPAINCIIRGGNDEEREILFKAFIGTDDLYVDKIRGKGEVEMGAQDYAIRLYTKLKRKQDKFVDKEVERLSEQIEKFKLNQSEIMVLDGRDVEDNTLIEL